MFRTCLVVNFGVSSPRDPAFPFVSKYVLHIYTTYQSGILCQRGGGVGEGGGGSGRGCEKITKKKTLHYL